MSQRAKGIITIIIILAMLPVGVSVSGFFADFYTSRSARIIINIFGSFMFPAFPISIMRVKNGLAHLDRYKFGFLFHYATDTESAFAYQRGLYLQNFFKWLGSYIVSVVCLPIIFIISIVAIIKNNPY